MGIHGKRYNPSQSILHKNTYVSEIIMLLFGQIFNTGLHCGNFVCFPTVRTSVGLHVLYAMVLPVCETGLMENVLTRHNGMRQI